MSLDQICQILLRSDADDARDLWDTDRGVMMGVDTESHFSKPRDLQLRHAAAMTNNDTTAAAAEVQRTDFVSVPVEDMERAKAFYRDTLEMSSPDWNASWPEIETGNVSLYLVDPTAMGITFAPHTAPLALRVKDVPEANASLRHAASRSPASTTPAFARWPSSTTPRATV